MVMPMLGSKREYHFVHPQVKANRKKRSIHHTKNLKTDPLVETAIQQAGYRRDKRGYKPLKSVLDELKPLENVDFPPKKGASEGDPLFDKEWYIVSSNKYIRTMTYKLFVDNQILFFRKILDKLVGYPVWI